MTCVIEGITQFYLTPNMNHTRLYFSVAQHHSPLAGSLCDYARRDGQVGFSARGSLSHLRYKLVKARK